MIRLATAGDLDPLWALVGRAVTHMNALGNPQWGADYPTRAFYADDLARGELYVAVAADGSILGVACLNTEQSEEYAPLPWQITAPAMVIHRMAVDPSAQRQGVATSLFAFAEALARQKGIPAVHVDTYAQNDRMQALFRGRGCREVGLVHFDREDRPLGFPCFEKVLEP